MKDRALSRQDEGFRLLGLCRQIGGEAGKQVVTRGPVCNEGADAVLDADEAFFLQMPQRASDRDRGRAGLRRQCRDGRKLHARPQVSAGDQLPKPLRDAEVAVPPVSILSHW